jgi:hypothetical protein
MSYVQTLLKQHGVNQRPTTRLPKFFKYSIEFVLPVLFAFTDLHIDQDNPSTKCAAHSAEPCEAPFHLLQ